VDFTGFAAGDFLAGAVFFTLVPFEDAIGLGVRLAFAAGALPFAVFLTVFTGFRCIFFPITTSVSAEDNL
jgi:hypothetical protein